MLLLDKTRLDRALYAAVLERSEYVADPILSSRWRAMVHEEGVLFHEELAYFQQLQRSLGDSCTTNADHPTCIWYRMLDLQFLRFIKNGRAPTVPFNL